MLGCAVHFAKDFSALDLKEVSENPIVNAKRRAKIYFDYFDITLSEGGSIDGRSVYALNYYSYKARLCKKLYT